MKLLIRILSMIVLIALHITELCEAEAFKESTIVNFSDPTRVGLIKVLYGKGDINVTGYEGKKVVIETRSTKKAKGMKRIAGASFNVTTIEDENAIVIKRSLDCEVELSIKVPFRTSLKLGSGKIGEIFKAKDGSGADRIERLELLRSYLGENDKVEDISQELPSYKIFEKLPVISKLFGTDLFKGNITVKNVSGEMDINTFYGDITLQDISSEVIANTLGKGNILISFKKVDRKSTMYFSTVDGDIDITFPPNIHTDLTLKNIDGDIYTDFEMDIEEKYEVDKNRLRRMSKKIASMHANRISGRINGGGAKIRMMTIGGDIYIRKGESEY